MEDGDDEPRIRGIDADLGTFNADTFFNDIHKNERFDFVLVNPPFNASDWGGEQLKEDPRWDFGTPPTGNANFAWMQHMIHHLADGGHMGMVLANGSLSSQQNNEGIIRQAIVEAGLVEGVVAMPDRLFYSTGILVSLWIISKEPNRQRTSSITSIRKRVKARYLLSPIKQEFQPSRSQRRISEQYD